MTEQYFPHVLLDEASQATEPAAMVPLQYGCQRLCLVGDDKQLPPLVKSSNADQLEVSIFERLRQTFPTHLLNIQYRMHPTLAAFPSLKFYENQLLNGVDAKDRPLPSGFPHNKGKPLLFLDTSMIKSREKSAGESKLNREEANEIKILVEQLLKAKDVNETEIGIISPYTAQVRLLKELLQKPKIDVHTVDGFQGQEREVIIFSAVRSNDDKLVGFLDNERRFNVLLTRARRGMIVVGNSTTLRSSALWREWIDWTERNACKAHVNRTDGQVTGPRSSQGRDRENEHASQDVARNYSGARSRDGRRGMGRGGRGRGGSSRGGSSKGGRGMVQNWERW
ncbi:probable helicase MAGATAMA 3 [Anneissia japonica]|uniref:probable helicase MAGATAMA 3 n=1 Tax=Anneissia japonica TaxID=1529436 RepID=UPI001425AF3C|nr:probable helicase MAGATAMA 3 [Anneissia japonica]